MLPLLLPTLVATALNLDKNTKLTSCYNYDNIEILVKSSINTLLVCDPAVHDTLRVGHHCAARRAPTHGHIFSPSFFNMSRQMHRHGLTTRDRINVGIVDASIDHYFSCTVAV